MNVFDYNKGARNRVILDTKAILAGGWVPSVFLHVENKELGLTHDYFPTPVQEAFHLVQAPNALLEGSKGTGKSKAIRNDAHMRAFAISGYKYLIVRKQMPELRKSHLLAPLLPREMKIFGGTFNKTESIAYYPNDSVGVYGHCGSEKDIEKLLSQEYDAVYFDEWVTFPWELSQEIALCARVPEGSDRIALTRGGTNPIGVSARDVYNYFIGHEVDPEDDLEYDPFEWVSIHTTLDDNPYIDAKQYRKKFSSIKSKWKQKALRDGEWVGSGAFFDEFEPVRVAEDGTRSPWHIDDAPPNLSPRVDPVTKLLYPAPIIYRVYDYGWFPDPSVCLWLAVYSNGRILFFKERTWTQTTIEKQATEIKAASEGFEVVDTFPDPTLFKNSKATNNDIGDLLEREGIPLNRDTKNDRIASGNAWHEALSTVLPDGLPRCVIYGPGCPNLWKTLPQIPRDIKNPERIPDGNDHYVIAGSYALMMLLSSPDVMKPEVENIIDRFMNQDSGDDAIPRIRRSA